MAGRTTISAKLSKTTSSIHGDSERGIDVLRALSLISQNIAQHLSTLNHSLFNLSEHLNGANCCLTSRGDVTSAVLRPLDSIQQPRNCGLTVEGVQEPSQQPQPMLQRLKQAANIAKIRER